VDFSFRDIADGRVDRYRLEKSFSRLSGSGWEYGYKEISMGLPVVLAKQGISRIIELDLSQDVEKDLDHSARALETKAHLVGNL
jgi:malate/lactate dehydrogenase